MTRSSLRTAKWIRKKNIGRSYGRNDSGRMRIGVSAPYSLLIVLAGLGIAAFADAETWFGPLIVGGGIAFLGLFIAATGWLLVRLP